MNYYLLPANGKIELIKLYPQHPGEPWILIPREKVFQLTVGEPLTWYTEKWDRVSNQALVEKGIRRDNRGSWYFKEDSTVSPIVISALDVEALGDKWVNTPPGKDEQYQLWDGDKWVVDEERKAEAAGNPRLSYEEIEAFVSALAANAAVSSAARK
jgi:hypothetical protein